jgi:hypothetical protein
MHLLVQPGVAARLFDDEVLRDQGLLSRILAVFPESEMGTRLWRATTEANLSNFSNFSSRIGEILATPAPTGHQRNELVPRVLEFSQGAQELWIEFADHIENADDGDLRSIHGLNKISTRGRIAAVLQLVESPPRFSLAST